MLKKVENKKEIAVFKDKQQRFSEWLDDVIKSNFTQGKPIIKNAMILWNEIDESGVENRYVAKFDCGLEEHEQFAQFLQRITTCSYFHEWLREHISDYLEFVN